MSYAAVCACIYQVWSSKNESYWNKRVPMVDAVVKQIKVNVESRGRAYMPKKVSASDTAWFDTL